MQNNLFDKLSDKIKTSPLYHMLLENDKYADEIYYFKEDKIKENKKIQITEKIPLQWIEKVKYFFENMFVQTFVFKTIDPKTKELKVWLIKAKSTDEVSDNVRKLYWYETFWFDTFKWNNLFEKFLLDPLFAFKSVKKTEVVNFSKQLWRLINAWVDLQSWLEVNIKNTKNWKFKSVLSDILETTRSWENMSIGCVKYPEVFSNLYVSLLSMSERKTANLWETLISLGVLLNKEVQLTWKMKSAMIMPIITIIWTIWVLIYLMTWMVPSIIELYRDVWDAIPAQTQMLMDMSDFLMSNWIYILFFLTLIVMGFKFSLRFLKVREVKDFLLSKIPFFWTMIKLREQIQFARIIGSMLEKNWDLIESFQICWEATDNTLYKNAISVIASNMKKWKSFYESMVEAQIIVWDIWNQNFLTILETWEKSWALDKALIDEAEQMEYDLEEAQARFVTILTPTILVVIWVIIWFIVWAALSPMYNADIWRNTI